MAESASVLVERTIRDIRGEIANLSEELNLAGSAADREKAYAEIRQRMAKLSRRLDALMATQNELAGKTAAKQAAEMTGLEVKYSAKRAEAITELVTPKQGENLAAVFTQRMAASLINSLQAATVAVLRQQAVEGGTMREMTRELARKWREAAKTAEPKFTDASGRTWDTKSYLAMNVRTNTMRVYNDCLLDDIARTTGSDIARISDDGGDPHCVCAAWAGCVISISGKTKGLPTYEQARNGGCFHPNCVHTIEYVDEDIDSEEIALAKAHPVQKGLEDDPDAQYERRREIDIDRKMHRDRSISRSDAELLVDRDNLTAAIRSGLIRSDARKLVDALTDAQVKALMTDNRPPRFEPTKKATKKDPHAADEKWIHGKRGGVVHIARDADAEKLIKVCSIKDAKMPDPPKVEKPKVEPLPKFKTSKEATEYIEKTYGIACKGFDKFSLEFCQGMVKAVADVKAHIGDSERLQGVWTFAEYYKKAFEVKRAQTAKSMAKLFGASISEPAIQKQIDDITKTKLRRAGITKSSQNYGCAVYFYDAESKELNGIILNNHLDRMDRRREVSSGFKAQGCENPLSTVYHELGHIIDYHLGIVDRTKTHIANDTIKSFWDKGRKEIEEKLSGYGSKNPREMIAEAWAEYKMNPNPREMALTIGRELDKLCGKNF